MECGVRRHRRECCIERHPKANRKQTEGIRRNSRSGCLDWANAPFFFIYALACSTDKPARGTSGAASLHATRLPGPHFGSLYIPPSSPCLCCTINSTFLCLNFSTLNLCDLQSSPKLLKSFKFLKIFEMKFLPISSSQLLDEFEPLGRVRQFDQRMFELTNFVSSTKIS